ncbi:MULTISPECIES: hypothetical protein [Azospirillum]|uniref:Glycosyl transferase-like protein n=2 Tax=Azospirillum brasilense TaxID=192 RepID=Q6QW23_AZOBR|nr:MULTISPECIES: hypothetical protein [Azospirillum]AAS83042.1 glycosyl transferase-like protein [Azospirillum brasilense]MDW7555773.1 hypothetical protein [Azospirillum brasilense]MDW7595791.1 hypothetical protein [Azospirillum brasilense]MDW7630796.1 hypothetical protein [Azospirillum brasilense]MDX5955812.1 hypothetical protein [Azospirillum brasilense]
MISVIVYGRNDSHGYNLHKRAALSLNSIAEVMTAPGDEIIFVDYNTPDDLPTFVEAILDTLTGRCRGMLRVVRVRPTLHALFADRTSYATVESVARNVGLRRSNPRNRWILSTNTDMVFLRRDGGRSLSELVDGLPDGFYQVPRFEVPESLWESLDRRDPRLAIERFRWWGARFHLNELVHTDPITRFDGIGDFQLALRSDLFAIHGFNEDMLAGWNVDMNLCHRLHRRYGRVDSLSGQVLAYHCGHTRLPTAIHRDDTVMNDPVRYIDRVVRDDLPEQAERWGLARHELEEFHADAPPSGLLPAALEESLPAQDDPGREAWNDFTNFSARFRLRLDPDHALPYVADLLATAPPDAVLAYVGSHRGMFERTLRAWRALGHGEAVLVPEGGVILDEVPGVEAVDALELDRRASLFLFEFALDDVWLAQDPCPCFEGIPEEGLRQLGLIYGLFIQQTERERQRLAAGKGTPRRFIGVPAVNTFFGMRFGERVMFTHTMFSTRVRHGQVRRTGLAVRSDGAGDETGRRLGAALGRAFPIDRQEVEIARGDLDLILAANGPDIVEPHRCTAVALALLDVVGAAVPEPVRRERRRWIEQNRPSRALRERIDPLIVSSSRPPGPPLLNKLCAAEDWEDAHWRTVAEEFTRDGLPFRASTYAYFKRSRGVWERTHMLYGMGRLGVIGHDARCAVISRAPDGLGHFLSLRTAGVDVIDLQGHEAGWLARRRMRWADRMSIHPDPASLSPDRSWNAVFIPQNTLLAAGLRQADSLLRHAARRLVEGGVIACSVETALDRRGRRDRPAPGRLAAVMRILADRSGLVSCGGVDWSLSDATLDRIAVRGEDSERRPHLVTRDDHGHRTCSVWFLRKEGHPQR